MKWRIVLQGPKIDYGTKERPRIVQDPPLYLPTYGTAQSPNWTPDILKAAEFKRKKDANFFFVRLRSKYVRGYVQVKKDDALTCPACSHTEGERIYGAPPNFPPRCKEDDLCKCMKCPWARAWTKQEREI